MSSELKRTAFRVKPDPEARRAKIWDNEHGRWKDLDLEELEAADMRFRAGKFEHATDREGHKITVIDKTFWDNTPCERAECTCGWRGEWMRKRL